MSILRAVVGVALLSVMSLLALPLLSIQIGPSAIGPRFLPYSNEGDFDDALLVQAVGTAYISFTPGQVAALLNVEELLTPQYLLAAEEYGIRFEQAWRAQWLPDALANEATLELVLWVKDWESDDYAIWQEEDVYLIEDGANAWEDALLLDFYPDEPGVYEMRLEARASADDALLKQAEQQLVVFALPPPNFVLDDPLTAFPQFGELERDGILLDWRGWHDGPCTMLDEVDAELLPFFEAACEAEGDFEALKEPLFAALEVLAERDDPELMAIVHDQLGVVAATCQYWDDAVYHFQQAHDLWLADEVAFHLAVTLHNLAVAQWQVGADEAVITSLVGAQTLREQMDDELGAALTWTHTTILFNDLEFIDGLIDWLDSFQLPQADSLRDWLEDPV